MPKRDIDLYLEDIKSSIGKIQSYTKDLSFNEFSQDGKTIDAVVRNLEIIGEAVRNIPAEIRIKYPKIPWKEITGTRDKVIHEYFGVDLEILWQTAKEDIPALKKQLKILVGKISKAKE